VQISEFDTYCLDSGVYFLTKTKNMVILIVLNNSNLFTYIMTYHIDKLTKDIGSFRLTSLLIKRVRELMAGSPALVETASNDPVQTAFEEVTSGKLSITDEVVTKD
jgi:DNA-directed RNA polymerase subunit K/omega